VKKDISPENYADVMWELIMSDDPAVIARLEEKLDGSQSEAVDEYIENSCWSQDLPHLVGNRGTPVERREALRAAYAGMTVYDPNAAPDDERDEYGEIGEDIERSDWRDDLVRMVHIETPSHRLREALGVAFVRQPVYEADGAPAAARALEELAAIVDDGLPYDSEMALAWINKRADLVLIGLEALEMLRLHRPREA